MPPTPSSSAARPTWAACRPSSPSSRTGRPSAGWHGAWRNKLAAGFTASASWNGDKHNTLYQLLTLALQHGMVWVGLGLPPGYNHSKGSTEDLNRLGASVGAMAQANADQGIEGIAASDFRTMEALGKRVAEAARALAATRRSPRRRDRREHLAGRRGSSSRPALARVGSQLLLADVPHTPAPAPAASPRRGPCGRRRTPCTGRARRSAPGP